MTKEIPKYMVTTVDNPFDYFTQFDEWNAYDTQHGYNTLAYLARVCVTNPDSSEIEKTMDINDAVEDILRLNITGMYKRIEEPENKIKNDGDISE